MVFCILADFLIVLLIFEIGVLKSPRTIVDLSISSFSSISFCFMRIEPLWLGAYTFRIAMSY